MARDSLETPAARGAAVSTGESDRRGPATAAKGSTRRAVNTYPASGRCSGSNLKMRQGQARNASDGFLGGLDWFRAGAMAGVEVAGEEAVCAAEASIQAF